MLFNISYMKKNPIFPPFSVLIDCFIYYLFLQHLDSGLWSSTQHWKSLAVDEIWDLWWWLIALCCVWDSVVLLRPTKFAVLSPAFTPGSGSSRKTVRPLFPLSVCFCHQRGTIKTSRSCGCSGYRVLTVGFAGKWLNFGASHSDDLTDFWWVFSPWQFICLTE